MFNKTLILIMKKVKFIFSLLAITFMVSACEFSPEEIEPIGKYLEFYPDVAGEDPPDEIPPPPPAN